LRIQLEQELSWSSFDTVVELCPDGESERHTYCHNETETRELDEA